MVDFKKVLAGSKKNWAAAKKRASERESSFQEYDDGRYLARLIGAEIGKSGSGRNQIDFSWKFMDGDYEGKVKHDYQGIDSEDNLYYLAARIDTLGYEVPDNPEDLPDVLKAIVKEKPVCTIRLKTKGDFQNVYVQKVHSDEDLEDEDVESEDDEVESDEEEVENDDAEEDTDEEDAEEADEGEEEEESEEDEAEEDEEEVDVTVDEEEVDVTVGTRVIAETAKGREPGKITKLLEKENAVVVQLDNGRNVRLSIEKIELPDEDEEIPEEPPARKPAKPSAKKPAPPAKKPAPKGKVTKPAKKTRR